MLLKNLLLDGSLHLPPSHLGTGGKILIVGILCFLSTIATTIYLHRYRTHNSLKLNKGLQYVFEFILWLTTGIKSVVWVVVHKYHHKYSDKEGDVHSPQHPINFLGINVYGPIVCFIKYFGLYANNKKKIGDKRIVSELKDESKFSIILFHKLSILGPIVLFLIFLIMFGSSAFWMSMVILLYLPIVAGAGVNGLGHSSHELNPETRDHASNLLGFIDRIPKWAYYTFSPVWFSLKTILNVMTGGEYRHYIHHFKLNSARLTLNPYEFDIGWGFIWFFWLLGLAKDIRYVSNRTHDLIYLR